MISKIFLVSGLLVFGAFNVYAVEGDSQGKLVNGQSGTASCPAPADSAVSRNKPGESREVVKTPEKNKNKSSPAHHAPPAEI